MDESQSKPGQPEYAIDQAPFEESESLRPDLKESLALSLSELKQNLDANKEASVVVFRDSAEQAGEDERLARQILMAGLGVKDHQVDVFRRSDSPDQSRYQERIVTNIPGVEIVYSDTPDGGRVISLAVNHDPSGAVRTSPTDIERVLRTARTRGEFVKSVEAFGGHWNIKQEQVKNAQLLSIDIDECIFPGVDRRAPDDETIQMLADKFGSLLRTMKIFLNTNRSAPETVKVLEEFERRGVELRGAMTEGGAIMIEKNEENQWEMKRNPDIAEDEWQAMQVCLEVVKNEYIDTSLGYAEPKISALTFDLHPNSGATGHQVLARIREVLVERGLPTTMTDRGVDVSEGGLQLLAGVDKAVGMRYIQHIEGVSKEECISVGDSRGDLPMFAESGVNAAPYNAARDAKLVVDYYSPFDAEYGVLDIVNQIEQIKTR
ncbi:MAG: HAD hydrolase family protein [bacterium]|nr:HAD hydrolase family protein [bacterium]